MGSHAAAAFPKASFYDRYKPPNEASFTLRSIDQLCERIRIEGYVR